MPTEYKGVVFRSRLEARWAVFFETLGFRWQYEPEGYELRDGTRYLPDFLLPTINTFAEVKPDGDPFDKAHKFAREAKRPILLCAGEPGGPMLLAAMWRRNLTLEPVCFNPDEQRLWFTPAEFEVKTFQAASARAARGHRFWNPRRAA